ncbi:hypothetical protein HJC99_02055 [Candidatus Saccharibacteria bacterium]|nr:hypothetical protein [Candidatus Saccharibacteria bacterium]
MDMGPRRPRQTEQVVAPPQHAATPPPPRPVRPPAPQPVPQPRPGRPVGPAPVQQQGRRPAPVVDEPLTEPAPARRSGGWMTALQVFLGVVIIAAVAAAIVVLYIRYYQ